VPCTFLLLKSRKRYISWEPPPDRVGLIDVRADNRPAALVLQHSIVRGLGQFLPLLESLFTRRVPFLRSSDSEELSCVRGLADLQVRFSQAGGSFSIGRV
jgi:hypothetical protein